MNGVNRNLGPYLMALKLETDKLDLRLGWLATLALWGLRAWELGLYIAFETKESVTEGEHRKKVEAARAEYGPVEDFAEVLVERYEGWTDGELESREERIVKPEAWERLHGEKEQEATKLLFA